MRGTALIIRTGWVDGGARKLCAEKFNFPLIENTLSHHQQHVNAVQVHSQDNNMCISTHCRQNSELEKRSITCRVQIAEGCGRLNRSLEHTMLDLCLHLI